MLTECPHRTNRATRVMAKLGPAGQPNQKAVAKRNGQNAFLQQLTHDYALHNRLLQDCSARGAPMTLKHSVQQLCHRPLFLATDKQQKLSKKGDQHRTDLSMWCICQGIWNELSKDHPGHAAGSEAQGQGQQEGEGVHKHEGGDSQQGLRQGCEECPPGCLLCAYPSGHQHSGHCQPLRDVVQANC